MKGIKEETIFKGTEEVIDICIRNNFYTRGNNRDYAKMLSKCEGRATTKKIHDIALDIMIHSSFEDRVMAYDLGVIMTMIKNKCCYTFYEEI